MHMHATYGLEAELQDWLLSPNPKVSAYGTSIPWFEDLHPRDEPV